MEQHNPQVRADSHGSAESISSLKDSVSSAFSSMSKREETKVLRDSSNSLASAVSRKKKQESSTDLWY
jgi:hypothetical protein